MIVKVAIKVSVLVSVEVDGVERSARVTGNVKMCGAGRSTTVNGNVTNGVGGLLRKASRRIWTLIASF